MSPERPWADASRPLAERVEALLAEMTLEEKLAQLGSVWLGAELGSGNVAPHAGGVRRPRAFEEAQRARARPPHPPVRHRARSTGRRRPPARRAAARARRAHAARHPGDRARGVPDRVHHARARRSTRPPLAWAATFDPDLVERMARAIGESMRAVGVHQGLSPVLDVVRDYRWGRVEETLGEDPYLVGMIGTRLRARAGARRRRRHAQALRRLLRLAGRPQPRAGRDRARASCRRACCRRSRWRCARAARAR